ncbi:MAG TPA: NAD(P)-dependent oxidoreductase [Chloroflexota bacterium]|nr:NAD(P)-dependent oxidoreductase [Chloroflexota bacterium]
MTSASQAHTSCVALSPASSRPTLGFIGLGAMGGHFARNLVRAGYRVLGFDLSAARLTECQAGGVQPSATAAAVVDGAEMVLTSMPSSESWVHLARAVLIPRARHGQLFIDVGTVAPPETRRAADRLAESGSSLVDAPLSGGPRVAETGTCYVFAGGTDEDFVRARPVLEIFGGGSAGGRLTHCGPTGSGQIAKGVNQLAMGLGAAAYLEAVSFAINAGLSPEIVERAIGDDTGWRAIVRGTARSIAEGRGQEISVKFRELPYFLQEARESGFDLPLSELLYDLCDQSDRVTVDDNRPAPSFFTRLTAR